MFQIMQLFLKYPFFFAWVENKLDSTVLTDIEHSVKLAGNNGGLYACRQFEKRMNRK
jgi:hypothetical protein